MPKIESFSLNMVETYLKRLDLRYMTDSDGDLVVQFGEDDDTGLEYTIFFCHQGDVYAILFLADRKFQKAEWGRAVMACNEWNREKRWPKAILYIDQEKGTGDIRLEGYLDLEHGIHQELLDDFTNYHVMGGASFWDWAYQESKL